MPYKDRETQLKAQRRHYQENREEYYQRQLSKRAVNRRFVLQYKKDNSKCTDCAISFPPYVLDFDHVPERGKKVRGIADLARESSLENLLVEMLKCDIVCANCHRVRTYNRSTALIQEALEVEGSSPS